VIGITQTGLGLSGDETVIRMSLIMYYDPERFGIAAADTIEIEGAHHIRASLRPAALSLFGAANVIVNATADVHGAAPGLYDMLEAPLAGTRRGGFRYVLDPAADVRPGAVPLKRVPAA